MSRRPASVAHHEHSGELGRPRVVDQGGPHYLTQAVGKECRRDLDALLFWHAETGDLSTEGDPYDELRPTRGKTHLFLASDNRDGTGFEGADDVDDEARWHEHGTVGLPGDLASGFYDEIGVRSAHVKLLAAQVEAKPDDAKTWSGAGARCPRRGYEGLQKRVTIGTELHGMLYSFLIRRIKTTGVVGPGDC